MTHAFDAFFHVWILAIIIGILVLSTVFGILRLYYIRHKDAIKVINEWKDPKMTHSYLKISKSARSVSAPSMFQQSSCR